MMPKAEVFETTYHNYLKQIADLKPAAIIDILGITSDDGDFVIPFMGKTYRVSAEGIYGPNGKRPDFGVCVVLCKYLLMCPVGVSNDRQWIPFRDIKDASPLIGYFENNVKRMLVENFAERLTALAAAAEKIGAQPVEMDLAYDLVRQIGVLPNVSTLLLFNDGDKEFPAMCSLLFEKRAQNYLDPECLAVVGGYVEYALREAAERM
jgi:hypothetical protein